MNESVPRKSASTDPHAASSAASHTPGPWTVYGELGEWCGVEDPNGTAIVIWADPADSLDDGGVRGPTAETASANARLIAAAPEMLFALKALVRNIQEAWPSLSHLPPLVAARDAIAKATTPAVPASAAANSKDDAQ